MCSVSLLVLFSFGLVLFCFSLSVVSVKEGWSLFLCGFCSPSARIYLPGKILLSYQNVSVLHLVAIAAASFTATKGIPSCPLRLVYYCLLLLFLGVVLRSKWVALVAISSFSPPPCPDMIGRLKFFFFGKLLLVWHLHYAEWGGLWYTLISSSDLRFFFHGTFSSTLSDVCFLYGPTHWAYWTHLALLNFFVAHSWLVCLLLTSSGKCHVICGDTPVWH